MTENENQYQLRYLTIEGPHSSQKTFTLYVYGAIVEQTLSENFFDCNKVGEKESGPLYGLAHSESRYDSRERMNTVHE